MSDAVNLLVMAPVLGDQRFLTEIDPRVRVIDGNEAFAAEIAERRGERTDVADWAAALPTREQRDALLRSADALILGFPVPVGLAGRAPRLRWIHHTQAGVSNLHGSDIWTSEVLLTSSRGRVAATAIAEYVLAGALSFARGLHEAELQRVEGTFARDRYDLLGLHGATIGIVGLGGIGREVARFARAMGMRVIATRRSVTQELHDVDGVDLLLPGDRVVELAAQSDFVAVCAQLTTQTDGLISEAVIAAMKPSGVLINVARGELLDEVALIAALRAGRIRGAVLDVYRGELDGKPPPPELRALPQVILTPHTSGIGAVSSDPLRELVGENLRRFLAGEQLLNVVDRGRGY